MVNDWKNIRDEGRVSNINFKKRASIIGVIIVVAIIIIAGMSIIIISYKSYKHHFYYSIQIVKNGTGNFSVIVPFPECDTNQSYWNNAILNSIKTNNSVIYGTVPTDYGLGLAIYSNESCSISIDTKSYFPVDTLSMKNTTNAEDKYHPNYWIYTSQSNSNISFYIFMSNEHVTESFVGLRLWASGGGPTIEIPEYHSEVFINEGWDLYKGFEGYMVVN